MSNRLRKCMAILDFLALSGAAMMLLSCAAAGRTRGSALSRLPPISTDHAELIEQLNSEDWKVANKAEEKLAKIGKPAVPALLQALTGEATRARSHAADALGEIKDLRAVEPLIWALGVSAPATRKRAAGALGKIGDAKAVEPLSRLLSDPDKNVREAAIWPLAKTDRTGVAFAYMIQAAGKADFESRAAYGGALHEILDNLTTLRELVRALSHTDDLVRKEVARYLGIYFKDHVSDPRQHPDAVAALMTVSLDTVPAVRGKALWALGQTKDPGTLPRLIEALDDREAEARKYAALGVAEVDQDLGAFPAFAEAYVRESDKDAKSYFGSALKTMTKRKTSYRAFVQWLVYPDADVRKIAAWGIGVAARDISEAPRQLRHVGAVEQLLRNLETEEDDYAHSAAIWALGYAAKHGDDRVVEMLVEEVTGPMRIAAINALAMVGEVEDSRFVGDILMWLNFKVTADDVFHLYDFQVDEKTQLAAAKAVGRLVSPESSRSIYSVLDSLDETRVKSEKVRLVVLKSLAEIAGRGRLDLSYYKRKDYKKDPWELLRPYLASSEPVQRLHAATVLADLGDLRAIDPIIALIEGDDYKISPKAATALAQMDDARATKALIAAFERAGEAGDRRVYIAKALGVQKHAQGVRFLVRSLENSDKSIVLDVATGLASADDPRGIDRLLKLLKEDSSGYGFFVPGLLESIESDVVTDRLLDTIPHAFLPQGYTLAVKRAGSRAIRPIIESYLTRDQRYELLDSYYITPLFPLTRRSRLVVNAYLSGDEDEVALISDEERKECFQIITGFTAFLNHEDPAVRRIAFVMLSLSEALSLVDLPPVTALAEKQMEQSLVVLGQAQTRHEMKTAAALFKRAVDMAPWWAEARFNLALIYEELGENKAAAQEIKYYLQLRPDADDAETSRVKIDSLEVLK